MTAPTFEGAYGRTATRMELVPVAVIAGLVWLLRDIHVQQARREAARIRAARARRSGSCSAVSTPTPCSAVASTRRSPEGKGSRL